MRLLAALALAAAVLTAGAAEARPFRPHQPAVAHHWIGQDLLSLRSEPWFAGAVSSIRFRGVEYVDAADHGRLLQGAIAFDAQLECLNPTLAGASSDARRRTTSRRLFAEAGDGTYASVTRMAYWLRPAQRCTWPDGRKPAAVNRTRLSDVVYSQRHTFGWAGVPNAVLAEIAYTTGVERRSAVVEALTLYSTDAFVAFHRFDPATGRLTADAVDPMAGTEGPLPVVVSTADGEHAFGLLSLDPGASYGRSVPAGVAKINLVYRPPGPYRAGEHRYRAVWAIGTREEVRAALVRLHPSSPAG